MPGSRKKQSRANKQAEVHNPPTTRPSRQLAVSCRVIRSIHTPYSVQERSYLVGRFGQKRPSVTKPIHSHATPCLASRGSAAQTNHTNIGMQKASSLVHSRLNQRQKHVTAVLPSSRHAMQCHVPSCSVPLYTWRLPIKAIEVGASILLAFNCQGVEVIFSSPALHL